MENITGYKVLDNNFRAITGFTFEEGKVYEYGDEIIPKKQGFHFAKRLEDTLRYTNLDSDQIIITEVTALGNVVTFSDEYYGYYDLYVTDKIIINRVLSRKEIIDYIIDLDEDRICRFISLMKLSPKEIRAFLDKSERVLKTIEYYQLDNKDAFKGNSFLPEWKEVKRYGKYYFRFC